LIVVHKPAVFDYDLGDEKSEKKNFERLCGFLSHSFTNSAG